MGRALCLACGERVDYRGRRGFRLAELACPACGAGELRGWRRPPRDAAQYCAECGRDLHRAELGAQDAPPVCLVCRRRGEREATAQRTAGGAGQDGGASRRAEE